MYLFLVLGLPLGFLLLVLASFPRDETLEARRTFLRGLLISIPLWILARLAGSLVHPIYGSLLLVFCEWADRILPYAGLPAAGYLVFYRYGDDLGYGRLERRLTAFYAGALSPMGLGEMVRVFGDSEPYPLLLLPFVLAALVLAMPRFIAEAVEGYGFGKVLAVLGAAAFSLAASLGPWLFLARLWPLAWLAGRPSAWTSRLRPGTAAS
jgi:hypothetical protein